MQKAATLTLTRRTFLCAAPLATLGCDARAKETQVRRRSIRAAEFRNAWRTDREVLVEAFNAWNRSGGILELEPGHTYRFGSKSDALDCLTLENVDNAVLEGHGATIQVRSVNDATFSVLRLSNCRNVHVRNLAATDLGYRDEQRGARFIAISAGSRGSGPFTFESLRGVRLLTLFHADGPPSPYRVRGIKLTGHCRAIRCYYAINFQDQGDGLAGRLVAVNCRRAYFPYGVTDHDITLSVQHEGLSAAPAAESAVLIKSYGRSTRRIRLDVSFSGVLAWVAANETLTPGSCVTIEHQSGRPSLIEDVAVTLNVAASTADPYGVHRVLLRSYSMDGKLEARTRNAWRNISITGNLRPGRAPALAATSAPMEPLVLRLTGPAAAVDAGPLRAGITVERIAAQPKA